MAGLASVELSVDCERCGLEGGIIEVYDALVSACRFGVPARTCCKLCGAATEGVVDRPAAKELREIPANRCPACLHELTSAAIDARRCEPCGATARLVETAKALPLETETDLEAALDRWAERERFPSRDALLAATFTVPNTAHLFACLARRAPLEILADPFANMGVRTTGSRPEPIKPAPSAMIELASSARPPSARATTPATERGIGPSAGAATSPPSPVPPTPPAVPPTPPAVTVNDARPRINALNALAAVELAPRDALAPSRPPPSAPPRAIVYPLVSVIAADGEVHPEERALIDRFLQSEGLLPLADHEFCVHHPSEVAHYVPKERREDVVKLMCETAAVDGMPDESERRVIRAYATAWNVDDEKLEFWMWGYESMNTSLARQLFLKLRRFVLSARWGDQEPGPP